MRDLAAKAGMSRSEVHRIEAAQSVSLEACIRVGLALGFDPQLTLRDRRSSSVRDADPVHAGMGEVEAGHLSPFGHVVRLDEPYQHYQFAGRADLIAADVEARALLHIENRTRFPDIQGFAGSWNAKRAYLGDELAKRLGIGGRWLSIDHVVVALWSAEVLHSLRMRSATFQSICPEPPTGFRGLVGRRTHSTVRAQHHRRLRSASRRASLSSAVGGSRKLPDARAAVPRLRRRAGSNACRPTCVTSLIPE